MSAPKRMKFTKRPLDIFFPELAEEEKKAEPARTDSVVSRMLAEIKKDELLLQKWKEEQEKLYSKKK